MIKAFHLRRTLRDGKVLVPVDGNGYPAVLYPELQVVHPPRFRLKPPFRQIAALSADLPVKKQIQILPAAEGGGQIIVLIPPAKQDLEALPALQLTGLQGNLIVLPALMPRAFFCALQPGMLSRFRQEASEETGLSRIQIPDRYVLEAGFCLIALQADPSSVFRGRTSDHAAVLRGNLQPSAALVVHEQLLHIVIGCAVCSAVVEPDHVGTPVHIGSIRQHGRVAGKPHGSRVALQARHIGSLHQRVVPGISPGSVFSQKYLRPVFREIVVTVMVRKKPLGSHVVMLVDEIASVFQGALPAPLIFRPRREGTCGIDQLYLGILFSHRPVDQRVALEKGVPDLLVSDGKIFQPEGRGMAQLRAVCSPFGIRPAVGELDQIQGVPDPGLHFIQGRDPLMMGIIAAGKDRKRLRPDVLAELKIFIIAQSQRLIIAPVAPSGRTVLRLAQRIFPAVHGIPVLRVQGTVVHQTASRKTHELRLHVRKQLRDVRSQAVFPAAEGLFREQGDMIQQQPLPARDGQSQPSCRYRPPRGQKQLILLPLLPGNGEFGGSAAVRSAVLLHPEKKRAVFSCRNRRITGEPVVFPFLQKNAVSEAQVPDPRAAASFRPQRKIMGTVRMEGPFRFDLKAGSGPVLLLFPRIEGMVLRIVHRCEFKGAVLHQLRIQAAVRGMVKIFKKDSEQIPQRLPGMNRIYGKDAGSGSFCRHVLLIHNGFSFCRRRQRLM